MLASLAVLAAAASLLPLPRDAGLTERARTATGHRLALPRAAMPRNAQGKPIDPRPWRASDGFSPDQPILVEDPRGDARALPGSTRIATSLLRDAPIALVDARTGRRQPAWAEPAPGTRRLVEIHPARTLAPGRRYVVGLRGGAPRAPREAAAVRVLARAGVARPSAAWSFTVASDRSLTGRLRRMVGQSASFTPTPVVGEVRDGGSSPDLGRRVTGRLTVPCYQRPGCEPGSRAAAEPTGTYEARFVCIIPRAALEPGAPPARAVLYGHGLLGSGDEAAGGPFPRLAQQYGLVICAADWIGMAREDVPTVLRAIGDLSHFATIPDRLQQGQLDFTLLGRAMTSPAGLAALPAFQRADGSPVLGGPLVFVGNSQGGIVGVPLAAVDRGIERTVLGVPGLGYGTLLPRSIDWTPFAGAFAQAYRRPADRAQALALMQILWDRGEGSGYAHRLRGRPVLLVEGFGDHQVANVQTETLARSIGATLRSPALDPGRSRDRPPLFGLRRSPAPTAPALLVYDIGPLRDGGALGTPPPPAGPEPPTVGVDPHGALGADPGVAAAALTFLLTGSVPDLCGPGPCYAAGWTGP